VEDFLILLDDYVPTIPPEVTDYFLNNTGFSCPDERVKKLIALATQKFLSDVVNDSLQYCKIRQSQSKTKKLVLTMDDLSQSLKEFGVNVSKPPYFSDTTGRQ